MKMQIWCNAWAYIIILAKPNPTQKFGKNLINFEKLQKPFKNPKLRSKWMKGMIQERNKIILDEENLI